MKIGQKIKEKRKYQGYSIDAFANILGIYPGNLKDIESNQDPEKMPDADLVIKIAIALGEDPLDLIWESLEADDLKDDFKKSFKELHPLLKMIMLMEEEKETGIEMITKEREEQVAIHFKSIEQDVKMNPNGQLIDAARALAYTKHSSRAISRPENWSPEYWEKVIQKPQIERLAIAGALIAAEIDRLQAIEINV